MTGPRATDRRPAPRLLEIVEHRYNASSVIITSQVPVDRWYEIVGDPTLVDAILDRLIHNAHRIELTGGNTAQAEGLCLTPATRL